MSLSIQDIRYAFRCLTRTLSYSPKFGQTAKV
jgi:hypothetical protein